MIGLTKKQKELLEFLRNFIEKEKMAPSVYEIADYFGLSTPTVIAHLKALQNKNCITRTNQARSIKLCNSEEQIMSKPKLMSFLLSIPLLGRIDMGFPSNIDEGKESEIYCDPDLVTDEVYGKLFALKVKDDSMQDAGIFYGDIVIVKQTDNIKSGDIVVVEVEGSATIKYYYSLGEGQVELRQASYNSSSQMHDSKSIKIHGKIISLRRRYS